MLLLGKVAFLFLTVLFTSANIMRLLAKNPVSDANMILMSVGIVGFITLMWLI